MATASVVRGQYPRNDEQRGVAMKIVSVMTTDSSGGAEFAAVEMLEALRQRGHETVHAHRSCPASAGTPTWRCSPISLGPKLSSTSWAGLAAALAAAARAPAPRAARPRRPTTCCWSTTRRSSCWPACCPTTLRGTVVWAEWGPVPFPLRKGQPAPRLPRGRRARRARDGGLRGDQALGRGGRRRGARSWSSRTCCAREEIRFSEEGRARVRAELGIPADAFVVGCISRFHPKKRNDVVVAAVERPG